MYDILELEPRVSEVNDIEVLLSLIDESTLSLDLERRSGSFGRLNQKPSG